jgi:peptidoglycan/LPS O-acetylase OafA/YrhL
MILNSSTAELLPAELVDLEQNRPVPAATVRLTAQASADRYVELDSLRGLAALTVVIGHFIGVYRNSPWFGFWNASPLRIFGAGHEAVILFFLLSGFVLAVPYSKPSSPSYTEFLIKRICRIYLPYVAALMVAAIGSYCFYSQKATGNSWIDQTWSERPTAHLICQHLLMLGHYDGAQLNTAFWSLVIEMRVSLIYPVLFWLTRYIPGAFLLPVTFIGTMGAAVLAGRKGPEGLCYTALYAGMFVFGIVINRHLAAILQWLRRRTAVAQSLLFTASLLCFEMPGILPIEGVYGRKLFVPLFLQDWLTFLGAAGILLCCLQLPRLGKALRHPAVLRLGTISYSVYLIHATVLFILIRMFVGEPYFGWLFALYLGATYLLSELFHRAVEHPCMLLGRRAGQMFRR